MHSRRGFLKSTLGACWTGAALLEQAVFRANRARAQAASGGPSLFDIKKVADGIYAAIAKPTAVLNCNAAIFENDKDLLVVDTHSKPSAVDALVAQLKREVTSKPVRYIVNSHFHWDHSQGTHAYKRLSPHADVIATDTTRNLLSEFGAQRLKASLEQMQKTLDGIQAKRGSITDAAERRRMDEQAAGIRAYIKEMQNYTPELPNITVSRDLVIHDKAHDLHLAFRGRGHTAGDIVVFCPQKRVVATGDLLHSSLPFCGDGYPSEWSATLIAVGQMPFTQVIGGHGPVQDGKKVLNYKAAYLEEVTFEVSRDRSKPVEKLQAELTPDKLRSMSSGYGEYLMGNFRAANPGRDAAAGLAAGIRTNVADIHSALNR